MMGGSLTDEANERLRVLYRAKLAEAENALSAIMASAVPDGEKIAKRRSRSITLWTNRVATLRRQVGD